MIKLEITLREGMYSELLDAAEKAQCAPIDERRTPQEFALECIETVLADRRMKKRLQYAS